jgi:TolA-binding protein
MDRIRATSLTIAALALTGGNFVFTSPASAGLTTQDEDDPAVLRQYLSGNGLLNRGLYDLAAEEYRGFLAAHPNHSKAPVARYGLSVALHRLGRPEESSRELEILFADPQFEFAAEVAFLLGQIRMSNGDFGGAAAALERIMRTQAAHELADDATALLLESLYRANQLDAMDEPFRALTERHGESPLRTRGELFWGLAELARGRFVEAGEHFSGMLERDAGGELAPRVRLLLAKSLHQAEEFDAAAARYREVIEEGDAELVPDALYGLATIVRREGDAEEAGELLDRFFEAAPEHPSIAAAHLERGRTHYDLSEFEAAARQFATAAERDESIGDSAAYWRAKAEMRLERFDEAAERLAAALAAHPESPLRAEMQYDRAVALLRAGRAPHAAAALRTFREEFPGHEMAADALHTIIVTLHNEKQFAQSAEAAGRFLDEYPGHSLTTSVHFLLAENLYLDAQFERAAEVFEEFLEAHSDDAQRDSAIFRLGMAYERLGRADDAEARLAEIANGAQTAEAFRPALLVLGDLAFARGDWAAAAARMSEYLSLGEAQPGADDALIKLALSQHRLSDLAGAVTSYEKLLGGHGDSPHASQAKFERGQALAALGRDDEAIEAFESVLDDSQAERFAPYALSHLGALAMKSSDFEAAIRRYEELHAAADEPSVRAEALFQQGQALMALGRHAEAATKFADVAQADSTSPRLALARANRAMALAKAGDAGAALEAIAEAMSQSGESLEDAQLAALLYERAWAHRGLDQPAEAQTAYRELISRHGDLALGRYARLELGEVLAESGEHEAAIDLLEPLRQPRENDPPEINERALYRLGVCFYEEERYEEAAAAFEECASSHSQTAFAASLHLLAGESYFRLDRQPKAREHLDRALAASNAPEIRGPALLRLGEALAALQEWPASQEAFADYLEEFTDSDLRYQAEFGLAFAQENQGEFDDAVEGYTDLIARHQGPTAARAQFQIGECLFAQKRHQEAVREFLKVDILYAYPEWSAAALFEAGRCFEALAETGQAKAQFEQVRQRFADTRWADLAGQRLAAIAAQAPPGGAGSANGRD